MDGSIADRTLGKIVVWRVFEYKCRWCLPAGRFFSIVPVRTRVFLDIMCNATWVIRVVYDVRSMLPVCTNITYRLSRQMKLSLAERLSRRSFDACLMLAALGPQSTDVSQARRLIHPNNQGCKRDMVWSMSSASPKSAAPFISYVMRR